VFTLITGALPFGQAGRSWPEPTLEIRWCERYVKRPNSPQNGAKGRLPMRSTSTAATSFLVGRSHVALHRAAAAASPTGNQDTPRGATRPRSGAVAPHEGNSSRSQTADFGVNRVRRRRRLRGRGRKCGDRHRPSGRPIRMLVMLVWVASRSRLWGINVAPALTGAVGCELLREGRRMGRRPWM
jgi:hypothetical protein